MNLDAYLRRVGYDGPLQASVDVLDALAFRHATTIAFENLDPFAGHPVELAPPALERKLVGEERGGYCFEHNLLLAQVLQAIGFQVSGLAARVLWTQPDEAITPRSHMLLRVEMEQGTRLVDVGFGGLTLTTSLALRDGEDQATPHETFRLQLRDGDWWMQARLPDRWATLYRFDLQRQYPVDYEASNYYLSTNPGSHFVTGLRVARPVAGGRHALRDRELSFHGLDGASERRTLADIAELRATLEGTFGIRLPQSPLLQARMAGLFAA
ncbi:arylamine N-acetyltransferase [Lysobacter sp. S4-A87]|uniref:arylamine N-acetyltransferase family protein n=1 Tax=Lysobacter sp. S4-A87 TaxID=2925843 RepID=UPI001F530A53|nr:arylamine N-acetyltransferase [Lysobacter sp. S4-A87]UNK49556.1 arylamine N-acetyltransferase [Lysobacter sp. S4-A87]